MTRGQGSLLRNLEFVQLAGLTNCCRLLAQLAGRHTRIGRWRPGTGCVGQEEIFAIGKGQQLPHDVGLFLPLCFRWLISPYLRQYEIQCQGYRKADEQDGGHLWCLLWRARLTGMPDRSETSFPDPF